MAATKSVLESANERTSLLDGRATLMMGSNNYLGLANHPRVVEAASLALRAYGAGTCMNPPLATTRVNEELRFAIAELHGSEDALLFTSCTSANVALLDTVITAGGVIFSDALNHASIIDGCRLSRGTSVRYSHADVEDLNKLVQTHNSRDRALIVSDGVFSMEGTAAALPELLAASKQAGALLAIDDSHSAGVVGPSGRGTAELHGSLGQVDFITGTFSKALGGAGGGYICTSRAWREQLVGSARMAIFSAPLQPAAAAAALAAVRLLQEDSGLVQKLASNARYFRASLRALSFEAPDLPSAIVPFFVGGSDNAESMSTALLARGIYIPAISFPVVGRGQARLRIQLSAFHTTADLDFAVEAIASEAKRIGLHDEPADASAVDA
jgi:glycine C-acetyltransferase